MSATNFLDEPFACPFCGSDDIDPYANYGSAIDEQGRKVSIDQYKCRECGERGWEGLTKWITYFGITTTNGDRTWDADDVQHAIDQHYDLFGALTNDGERDDSLLPDGERVLNVYEV